MVRLILAATLGANYGIYGPAFELMEHEPREPGSEEYLDSEKYQLRAWNLERADSLRELIARVNRIRRDNPALQQRPQPALPRDRQRIADRLQQDHRGRHRLGARDRQSRSAPRARRLAEPGSGGPRAARAISPSRRMTCSRAPASCGRARATMSSLDPVQSPAHIFRIRRKVRTERDFDYFL